MTSAAVRGRDGSVFPCSGPLTPDEISGEPNYFICFFDAGGRIGFMGNVKGMNTRFDPIQVPTSCDRGRAEFTLVLKPRDAFGDRRVHAIGLGEKIAAVVGNGCCTIAHMCENGLLDAVRV